MIHAFIDFLRSLTSPDGLRHLLSQVFSGWFGYAALCGIVFSETGLLAGFFLPGDSLLFTVGVVAGDGVLNIGLVIVLLSLSAMIGDSTGYFLGRRTGQAIFSRPDSLLFKREHLLRTKAFYERYGGRTIVYARFVPIVRAFTAFVAGVARDAVSPFSALQHLRRIGVGHALHGCGILSRQAPICAAKLRKGAPRDHCPFARAGCIGVPEGACALGKRVGFRQSYRLLLLRRLRVTPRSSQWRTAQASFWGGCTAGN